MVDMTTEKVGILVANRHTIHSKDLKMTGVCQHILSEIGAMYQVHGDQS